jgi:hypothetical protein
VPRPSKVLLKEREGNSSGLQHASSSCRESYCLRREIKRDGEIKLLCLDICSFLFLLSTAAFGFLLKLFGVVGLVLQ